MEHLIFCCSPSCREIKAGELIESFNSFPIIKENNRLIIHNDDIYRFFIGINNHPEHLMGIRNGDYDTCAHCHLSSEVRAVCDTNMIVKK
jgi:hypothetical protein